MGVPPLPTVHGPDTWTDVQGLASLRRAAQQDGKAALPAVARQFEAVFTRMMIKSMRDAGFGGGIMDSPATKQWRSMFDNQIALTLANDGKGLGVAAMLVRQLGGTPAGSGAETAATVAGSVSAPEPAPSLRSLSQAARTARTLSAYAPAQPATRTAASSAGDLVHNALQMAEQAGHDALQAARKLVFSSPADFVKTLAPYARAAAAKLGVSMRAVLAQAALETGWGRHMPGQDGGQSSHNLFGIKAGNDWQGGQVEAPTTEFVAGVATARRAAFRAYGDLKQSFADYTQLLAGNPRYAAALDQGDDVAGFADALHRAGYATDPDYASKLTTVANSDTMTQALAALKNAAAAPTGEP